MQPEILSPRQWLANQPLEATEQVFAIFCSASAAEPYKAWQRLRPSHAAKAVWRDTAYAEWEAVMPYVGIVCANSEFLQWAEQTDFKDWGWLAISSASEEAVVEHFRSLTQVVLPNGNAVFFRFWDGRYLLPILRSCEVNAAQLMPVIRRCLINGQALDVGGTALKSTEVFPWWNVSPVLLEELAQQSDTTQVNNLLKWLSEERPDLFEAFSASVLRPKVVQFLAKPELPASLTSALVEHLLAELI